MLLPTGEARKSGAGTSGRNPTNSLSPEEPGKLGPASADREKNEKNSSTVKAPIDPSIRKPLVVPAIPNPGPTISNQSNAIVSHAKRASVSYINRANDFGSMNTVSGILALGQQPKPQSEVRQQARPQPDVVRMVGPVSQNRNLNELPRIPVTPQEEEEVRLTRHPPRPDLGPGVSDPPRIFKKLLLPANMPSTLLSFDGISSVVSSCGCAPPDPNGDVGPNHYVQSVNLKIQIYDKTGAIVGGPTSYNSFFAPLVGTPCANQNQGDGIVFYDHIADRWVVSDFAFPSFPGTAFFQCVGVSQTPDPVAGGWYLYAVQVDPANPTFLGDYPKFGVWPDAYYMSVNLCSSAIAFQGVRVFALDRNSMIAGGPLRNRVHNHPANLGDQCSFLPATFRTGSPPPAGQPEWFMNIVKALRSRATLTQVFANAFMSILRRQPIRSSALARATRPTESHGQRLCGRVFQRDDRPGAATWHGNKLDTLGDKLMYPLVYKIGPAWNPSIRRIRLTIIWAGLDPRRFAGISSM